MKVPSYDDLTPSIADVHPRDTFDQVTRLVPPDGPVVRHRALADAHAAGLFACLTHLRAAVTFPRSGGQAHLRAAASFPRSGGQARTPNTEHRIPETEHRTLSTEHRTPALVAALARDFSPRIERHGETSVVLDIAGLGRLLGDAEGIASELLRTSVERGIKCSIGVAPTQTAARLLAFANAETTVVTGDVAAAVASLPLETLTAVTDADATGRLFDILRRWGLRTIGEFAALPPEEIAARFGQGGVAVQRLAQGRDPRPLIPDPGVPRFVEAMELEWPIEELEPLSFVFARLLDPLSAALERADRAGAAIRVDLRLVDRTTHSRMLQLPAPIRDPRVLRTLLLLDLESHPPSAGIDIVTIEVDPAPSRIVQFSLLERATPSPETLATLTARLNALVGETRCGSPVLLDSYRPDAFEMQPFTVARLPAEAQLAKVGRAKVDDLVLRRFRPPVVVRVTVEQGRPVRVAIDRKGMPGGSVTQSAGPWRTSGGWWDGGEHWDRDEWDVSLSDGSLCRLYRDRVTERWFVEAVID